MILFLALLTSVCFYCVTFNFVSTELTDWMGRVSKMTHLGHIAVLSRCGLLLHME